MRALFSLIGLVLVLGVIGVAARKQLDALGYGHGVAAASAPATGMGRSPTPAAVDGQGAADPGAATAVPPRQVVERARADLQRAMEQGAAQRAPD